MAETLRVERARLDALMRMLVDSGDMTPMAVRLFNEVLDEATHD